MEWKRRRLALALAGGAALIVAGAALYVWHLYRRGNIDSVAVLPFVNTSARRDDAWLADGLAEELIDTLARVPGLRVAGRDSAFHFQGKEDVRAAAQRLGVMAVLEGSAGLSGERVRITGQLTRTADGYRYWTHTWNSPARDLYSIEQAIAGDVAGLVAHAGRLRKPRRPPAPAAYEAYLEGRRLGGADGGDALRQRIARLSAAVNADPEFAVAWARLAIMNQRLVETGTVRPNELMPGARDAADRAAALDPDLPEAHAAVGIVDLQYDWKWADAKKELDRALQLAPGSAWMRAWRARWYESQSRLDEALAEFQAALKLDPLSDDLLCDIAQACRYDGRPQLGIPYAQRASDPLCLAEAEYAAGRTDRPLPAGGDPFRLAVLATRRGERSPGARLMDTAQDLRAQRYISPLEFARVAAAMKDYDPMFEWLGVAYDERSLGMPYFHLWPDMPRDDPRFTELMEKMNLPARR